MKRLFFALLIIISCPSFGQYNTLWIPDTISGTTFNLNLNQSSKKYLTGNATNTYGVNADSIWGPTLIMNQGDSVQMHVTNNLMDSTTCHWHGFHIPAMMDGGPHQPIAPGATWSPTFKIRNNAAMFWYHPHLHMMTKYQMTMGLGGLIIIRDPQEAALNLPRTYGVDDIPMVLQSRRFTGTHQFDTSANYGDSMLVNGTMTAQTNIPAQVVKLRILNADEERSYNIGFSDNRSFYLIGTDGGLVNAPVSLTRVKLAVGERAEILVNCSGQQGTSVELMAYNAGQGMGYPGGEPQTTGQFGSALNNKNFNMVHLNIGAATSSPVTLIPTALVSNTYWTTANVNVNRTVKLTLGFPGGLPFMFDSTTYDMMRIDKTVKLDDVEQWTLTNISGFSHAFHIHDIQFNIVSRSVGGVASYEQGWKDVVYVPQNQSVSFITKFTDFVDSTNPYMYHCHFGFHEDQGMMGQFVVVNNTTKVATIENKNSGFSIYPNPANDKLNFELQGNIKISSVDIIDISGKIMLNCSNLSKNSIDINGLPNGLYFVVAKDESGTAYHQKFMKE